MVAAVTGPRYADRSPKARFESVCPACHGRIRRLQKIARTGGQWLHATCLIEANRRIAALQAAADALAKIATEPEET
jgi:hypothetical protein